jgi:hypothetical protein
MLLVFPRNDSVLRLLYLMLSDNDDEATTTTTTTTSLSWERGIPLTILTKDTQLGFCIALLRGTDTPHVPVRTDVWLGRHRVAR